MQSIKEVRFEFPCVTDFKRSDLAQFSSSCQIRSDLPSPDPSSDFSSSSFAARPSDDSLTGLAELQAAHKNLQDSYEKLSIQHQLLTEEHSAELRSLNGPGGKQPVRAVDNGRTEAGFKAEIDRLQKELSRTESIIADSEKTASKQRGEIESLTRRLDELSAKAIQAEHLKDQLDEHKHASDKVKKMENTVEKYKKKLEDAAAARRMVRALEDENLALLEKHTALEEELQQASMQKPLVFSYKSTISELEEKIGKLNQENDDLRNQVKEKTERLEAAEGELSAEKEAVTLLEERLQEVEQVGEANPRRPKGQNGKTNEGVDGSSDDEEDNEHNLSGMAIELDSAVSGRTTTDLKLQIRKLSRELRTVLANKADASRIIVLETLLEDNKRMKARYEEQYLSERRDRLHLDSQLEKIRNGQTTKADR